MSLARLNFGREGERDGEERKDAYGVAYANGCVENGVGWDSRSACGSGGDDTGTVKPFGGLKGGMLW